MNSYRRLNNISKVLDISNCTLDMMFAQSNVTIFKGVNIFPVPDGNELESIIKIISTNLMAASVKLIELDFSNNVNGAHIIHGLLELLASPCCISLKKLNISQLHCGPQCVKNLLDVLKTARLLNNGMSMNLSVLIASSNDFGDEGTKMISECLANMTGLHTLDLSDNNIGIKGFINLVTSIKDHSNFKILKLSHNNLASKEMSEALQRFKHLEEVDLGYCKIDNDGMYYLTSALSFISNNLAVLSIEGNQFDYLHGRRFITMLAQSKPNIIRLDLRKNSLFKWQILDIENILARSYKNCVLLADDDDSDDNYEENVDSDITDYDVNENGFEDEFNGEAFDNIEWDTAIPETTTESLDEMSQVFTMITMNININGASIEEITPQSGTVFDSIVQDIHLHDVWDPGDLL